uniref:Uncharacterized protein n=1 Tax=Glossina brevipalpis TaxID=37001 RepID=A0A1A9WWR7_9MUSC
MRKKDQSNYELKWIMFCWVRLLLPHNESEMPASQPANIVNIKETNTKIPVQIATLRKETLPLLDLLDIILE